MIPPMRFNPFRKAKLQTNESRPLPEYLRRHIAAQDAGEFQAGIRPVSSSKPPVR